MADYGYRVVHTRFCDAQAEEVIYRTWDWRSARNKMNRIADDAAEDGYEITRDDTYEIERRREEDGELCDRWVLEEFEQR